MVDIPCATAEEKKKEGRKKERRKKERRNHRAKI